MWRARTYLATALGALALILLVGGLGANAAASTAASTACHARYHPLATCAVPSGGSIDPCSIVSAGTIHCPINLPDLNPADWLSWLGCAIVADASDIWNAIVGDLDTYLTTIVDDLVTAFEVPFNEVLTALESAVSGVVTAFGDLLTGFFAAVNSVAAPIGPLAPVLVVTLTLAIFLVAGIGLYFAFIFLIAVGKSIYNIL